MKCNKTGDCPSKKNGQCTANPTGYCPHQPKDKEEKVETIKK